MASRRAAEERHERVLGQRRDIADGDETGRAELARGHRPDAPELLDGEWVEEIELAVGRHDEQPVGLRDRTRNLGQELRPGNPDRDRKPDVLADVVAKPDGDFAWRPGEPLHPRTSRNASSIERPSTSGDASSKTSNIALLASEYAASAAGRRSRRGSGAWPRQRSSQF